MRKTEFRTILSMGIIFYVYNQLLVLKVHTFAFEISFNIETITLPSE